MNADIWIEEKLNQIINAITEQNRIRLRELNRYPMVILYGEFPDILKEMIRAEVTGQVGDKNAVEFISVFSGTGLGEKIEEAFDLFRRRMNEKDLNMTLQYYIPIIFMADRLDVEEMKEMLQELSCWMAHLGIDYEVWYYCIFNYTEMGGDECGKQILQLQNDPEYGFPMSIMTHDNMAAGEYSQYLKAVQAVAMHIFLKISRKEQSAFPVRTREQRSKQFVMGYWKFDILKQQIAKYLIYFIEKQDEDIINTIDYYNRIRNIIDGIVVFNETTWVRDICDMPVNYQNMKELLQQKHFHFTRVTKTCREICEILYGNPDVFSLFIKSNVRKGNDRTNINAFFTKHIGNLFAVSYKLKNVLIKIKEKYEDERKTLIEGRDSTGKLFLKRNTGIKDIIFQLKSVLWENEAKIIAIEQKISFVESLIIYIDSEDFKEKIRRIREQNQTEIRRLKSIQCGIIWPDSSLLDESYGQVMREEGEQGLVWDEDIFDERRMKQITGILSQIPIEREIRYQRDRALDNFILYLHEIKMKDVCTQYYSARIKNLQHNGEEEYLFIREREDTGQKMHDEFPESVRTKLPGVHIFERNWEMEMCLELFAIREIARLDDIYHLKAEGG